MAALSRGPYLNEDGDWWVAIEDVASFAEARKAVIDCLWYSIPDEGRLAYLGKTTTGLCDVHTADEIPACCDADCTRRVPAYHFEERRPW